ncbi:MAG: DinB family protein [Gemmatimonadaceae bacterium]|jgi:hypothetical protein|nr:DinB family protein [Gemmatimonadaceae bacterium]
MTTSSTTHDHTNEATRDGDLAVRILAEGYGPGAWHGPDLKAALADVDATAAFRRPATGRHNIAEIALHHAWCVRAATTRMAGDDGAPFPLEGEDWFELSDRGPLDWARITGEVEQRQYALTTLVEELRDGRTQSPLSNTERFDLLLGVTCHAIYHAGQVQLIKALAKVG